jgi:uncharacterized membrane protein YjfL (UPF0719 family)
MAPAIAVSACLVGLGFAVFGLVAAHKADDTVGAGIAATASALGLLIGVALGLALPT